MNAQNNAAQVAVQAAAYPAQPNDVLDCIALGLPLSTLGTSAATGEQAQHDPEQLEIALQGTYEAESILRHMLRHDSDEPEHAWVKAFVLRLNAINSVCMPARLHWLWVALWWCHSSQPRGHARRPTLTTCTNWRELTLCAPALPKYWRA